MSQHHPAPDETVRMRPDGGDGPPPPTGQTPAYEAAPDDTRPVGRDWQRGAPAAPATAGTSSAETGPTETGPTETGPTEAGSPGTAPSGTTAAHDASAEAAPVQQAGSTGTEPGRDASREEDPAGTAVIPPVDDRTTALPAEDGDVLPTVPVDQGASLAARSPGNGGADGPPTGDGGTEGPRGPWWRRRAALVPAGVLAALAVLYGADLLVASGEVPRNTVVAGVDVGGLAPASAAQRLEERLAPRVVADHPVTAADVTGTLSPATAGITLDVPATVDAAEEQPLNPWTRLVTLFSDREVEPVITGEETALQAQIEGIAAQVDRAPQDATIAIEGTTPAVVEPVDGRTLDREGAAEAITEALASGGDPSTPIELPVDVDPVRVDAEEATRVLEETVTPALSAPVQVVSQDGATSVEVPVTAIAGSLTFTPQDDGELAVGLDPEALGTGLGDELSEFGTPAQDATFEVSGDTVSVVPSVDGTGIAPARLAEQLLPVLTEQAPRTVTAELGPVPAEFTTQEAEALGIREEISSFTTNIGNPASGTNIRVVAEEVDGAIIMPGETFSLNGFTGPRGLAQGYVEAGVINNGEFTTAVGGGISQFATTMFNAVFFAGLEDVFHKPHSYYISRYPAGREATVYYDSIDLKWRNDGDTGVYVDTAWTPGTITVTFYGTKRYEIQSISSERYNIRQPVVQDKPDSPTCEPQAGSTGFDITVTRVFRDLGTGAEIRREDFRTRYAAEPVINCVPVEPPAPGPEGTAPGGAPAPGGRRPSRARAA
ncbi:vanomycin resistance protein VanB [Blastococcus sp. MG754426]|uniref:VanW family protein n=1 Tax=unclassified Blastococcus TaxID=2619396 RepID=UPI001EF121D6|nr:MULTISPECIES: VanW family protein [unclassified Blastococcus]MCF6506331.1 vanomycin resistance protein VanB [Blastococcus sp. MG754426]MCF6510853.1 vanomycin resistance protein VanB [Blastococcus sp. MG754427]